MEGAGMKCADCRFFDRGHSVNLCRRNPPSDEGWPEVNGIDWCGEFVRDIRAVEPEELIREWLNTKPAE